MTKYIVYSKVPETCVFWRSNNVSPLEYFDNFGEAENFRKEVAHKYLHELTDSGYKLELMDNVYVIMQKKTEVLPGYIYNSTIVKDVPIISFHLTKCDKKETNNNIQRNVVVIKSNGSSPEALTSNQVSLILELTKYLREGIKLKKVNTQ